MRGTLFEKDKDELRPYKYCGALLFAAEVLPLAIMLALVIFVPKMDMLLKSIVTMVLSYGMLLWIILLGHRRAGTDVGTRLGATDIFIGLAAAAAFYPSAVIVASAASALFGPGAGSDSEIAMFVSNAGIYASMLVLAVVPAVSEELMIRGFFYGTVRRRRGAIFTIAVTALCFGLLHPGAAQCVYAVYCGIYLGMVREYTGSVWGGVAAHCGLNLAAMFFSTPASAGVMAAIESVPVPLYAGCAVFLAGACALALCRKIYGHGSDRSIFPLAVSPAGMLFLAGAVLVRIIAS